MNNELKKLMAEFEAAEKKHDRLDDLWENDYDNEELEKEWTEAYKVLTNARKRLEGAIVSLTNGKIDAKTARMIIHTKRDELKSLIDRLA